ncbi:rhomboid family intramembrane serine protease [Maribacter sp. R77961]|uniref:rhomboid family intramembrane serine protease n=1 Tax=Maribacter sp. R77961 TaxID=3093871 RepID=UPI0037CC28D6
MNDSQHFRFTNAVLLVPLAAVLLIWGFYWMELVNGTNLNYLGVYPRTLLGLRGVLISPLVHGSLEHLYNNTIPLAILLTALFYFYRKVAWNVLFTGIILSGLLTWLIGRPSYHIGASGLIYVLASFIFFKGIYTKYYRLVALSLVVVFIYGSLLWYIFPVKEGISWEGHLSGFVTGMVMAIFVKAKLPEQKKYDWEREDYNEEEDEFLKQFDENGNFIETPVDNQQELADQINIKYVYKEGNSEQKS